MIQVRTFCRLPRSRIISSICVTFGVHGAQFQIDTWGFHTSERHDFAFNRCLQKSSYVSNWFQIDFTSHAMTCLCLRIQTWRLLRLEVFLGLCTLSSKKANQRDVVIRCWCHEIQRVHLSWLICMDHVIVHVKNCHQISWNDVKLHRLLCNAKNARSSVIGSLTTRIRSGWRRKSSETWLKTIKHEVLMILCCEKLWT